MPQTTQSTETSFRQANSAPIEIELKLELDPTVLDRLKSHPACQQAPVSSADQSTVYFDTPDGALRKAGFSLRVRSSGGRFIQTVKPTSASAGLFSRDEWDAEVTSAEPDLARLAATPLAEQAASGSLAALTPILHSDVRRTSWIVAEGSGRLQIDLDEGSISASGRDERFCELELELLDGEPAFAIALARSIAATVPVRLGVQTKAERGWALADGTAGKVRKAAAVAVKPEMSVAEGFVVIAHACLKHFRLNEPILLHQRAVSALHQSRVAMRRLRSAFTLFKRTIADDEFARLREELRWFTGTLGEGRNLDVFLQRETIQPEQRRQLETRREAAYDDIAATVQSERLRTLMLDLVAWLEIGDWRTNAKAQRPLPPFARKRLSALWRWIESEGAALSRLDEERRHELRIQVKKLRYALEFLEALFRDHRPRQKRFAAKVAELQEALGLLNDMATARALTADMPEADGGWLLTQPGEREQHLLEAAENHLDALRKVGPYWLDTKSVASAQAGNECRQPEIW